MVFLIESKMQAGVVVIDEIQIKRQENDVEPVIRPSFKVIWKEVTLFVILVVSLFASIQPIVNFLRYILNGLNQQLPTWFVAELYNNSTYLCLGLCWILAFRMWYQKNGYELSFNNEFIELKTGIFATKSIRLKMSYVTTVESNQTIIEKLLGIGTVEVGTASNDHMEVVIKGIDSPHAVAEKIRSYTTE